VPIALESTTVILTGWRSSRRASNVAAIHPAVPPPTMTIERSGPRADAGPGVLPVMTNSPSTQSGVQVPATPMKAGGHLRHTLRLRT